MKKTLTILTACSFLLAGCCTRSGIETPVALHTPPPTDTSPAALQKLESYADEQDGFFQEFRQSPVQAFRDRSAYVLSELWNAGLLKDEIKEALVKEHFRVVLIQIYGNYNAPNFVVRSVQTFPFPNVWTDFTPTLYRNGQVEWSPGKPQTSHAMSQNNSTLTSRIGGVVSNGDVLHYQIEMRQGEGNQKREWHMTVRTNPLVVSGLDKHRASTIRFGRE